MLKSGSGRVFLSECFSHFDIISENESERVYRVHYSFSSAKSLDYLEDFSVDLSIPKDIRVTMSRVYFPNKYKTGQEVMAVFCEKIVAHFLKKDISPHDLQGIKSLMYEMGSLDDSGFKGKGQFSYHVGNALGLIIREAGGYEVFLEHMGDKLTQRRTNIQSHTLEERYIAIIETAIIIAGAQKEKLPLPEEVKIAIKNVRLGSYMNSEYLLKALEVFSFKDDDQFKKFLADEIRDGSNTGLKIEEKELIKKALLNNGG